MSQYSSNRLLLPAVAFLVLAAVGFDFGRRSLPPAPSEARSESSIVRPARATTVRRSTLGGRSASARREAARERLRAEAHRTFLGRMLLETDSMLRRWPDERRQRPLRVAIVRTAADGFTEDYVSRVNWAISRWNGATPVQMETGADSLSADIVVRWVAQLDSNRTGRTDLTWDTRGHVRLAIVNLATHTPEGHLLDGRQMTALALHELGHAIGLGHSTSNQDALYPVTRATDLSERDRRTAWVLYDMAPGSVRE